MLCKHLVAACQPIAGRVSFFDNVKRCRKPPFLVHPQLNPLQPQDTGGMSMESGWDPEVPNIDPGVLFGDQLIPMRMTK